MGRKQALRTRILCRITFAFAALHAQRSELKASVNNALLGSNPFCIGGENIGYAPVLVLEGREQLSKCLILFF